MLKTLAYRQALFVLDLLIVALIACVGFFGVKGVMAAKSAIAPPLVEATEVQPMPAIAELASYEPIVTNKLFGNPPAAPVGPAVPEPTLEDIAGETELPLKLGGTIVAGAVSSAIIFDESRRLADVYYLNQDIIPKVKLVEVRKDSVVLDNGNTGKRETLTREGEDDGTGVPGAPTLPQTHMASRSSAVREVDGAKVVNRQEVIRELSQNAAKLLTEVKPEFKKDAQGNTIGVTSSNIGAIPLAKEVGLQNNDVVTSINGELIDSEAKLSQLMQKYGNATTVRIGIQRNGRPQVLTLRLE